MNKCQQIYERLYSHFGPQDWWPGETRLEVVVGAVLTQNTNWPNVCKAIDNLRHAGMLSFEAILSMAVESLAQYIRPSGYYNIKAGRLKNLIAMFAEQCDGDLALFFQQDTEECRRKLLEVKGVGAETADSILLYAGKKSVFVVDTYTHRIFSRHNMVEDECDYETLQDLFLANLPEDTVIFNEYHALIVAVGKEYCKKKAPLCANCPLNGV